MDHLTDQELVAACLDGIEGAFDVLVRRHASAVFRFVCRLVGDAAEAEDLTQEVFLRVWRNLKRFDAAKSFKAWLFRIARNAAYDALRKRKNIRLDPLDGEDGSFADAVADESPLPDEAVWTTEIQEGLNRAIESLAPKAKSVVILHGIEGLTFQEVADVVDEPLNTVKSRYLRALKTLRESLMGKENR